MRVQAINAAGAGEWSHTSTHATCAGEPGACPHLAVSSSSRNSISICWGQPRTNGAAVTRYHVDIAAMPNCFWQHLAAVDGLAVTAENLLPEQEYRFRVRAENAVRPGPDCCTRCRRLRVTGRLCFPRRCHEPTCAQHDDTWGSMWWQNCAVLQRGIGAESRVLSGRTTSVAQCVPRCVHVAHTSCTSAVVRWQEGCDMGAGEAVFQAHLCAVSPFARRQCGDNLADALHWRIVYEGVSGGCAVSHLQAGCNYRLQVRYVVDGTPGPWCKEVPVRSIPLPCPCSADTLACLQLLAWVVCS